MHVVIDCNIFVMCLTSRSPYHIIYTSLTQQKYTLILSEEILLEYEEIIQKKYGIAAANSLVSLLKELPNVVFKTLYYKWHLITVDEEDNKYCDCAIAGGANYLVTEDNHFKILKKIDFPKINTLSIEEFVKIIS